MASPGPLPHLWIQGHAQTEDFHRSGGGHKKIRDVERRAHGTALLKELREAVEEFERLRDDQDLTLDELRALGVVLVLEGADAAFPLKVRSLDSTTRHKSPRPQWLLLSVIPATDVRPERAQVWVSDEYRSRFLALFEDYLGKTTKEKKNPKNLELVANIGRIRRAVLNDLWQSKEPPPTQGTYWWELWLRRTDDALDRVRTYAGVIGAEVAVRSLTLNDRTVVWINARWQDLQGLPFTDVPLAEIRQPEFVDAIQDLSRDDQQELADDLVRRLQPRDDPSAPAVCHLDTGVRRSHALLSGSLAEADVHSVVGSPGGADVDGHGTAMAGLALFGPLDVPLLSTAPIVLEHRLESVKMLPDPGRAENDPLAYGLITAQAVAQPEATVARPRVFCMPITTKADGNDGEPTLWSASVDALAAGTDIGQADNGIQLLGAPDPAAARLLLVSGGNVAVTDFQPDYRAACDVSMVQDPAQAWNALTVGACTDLDETPSSPDFAGWAPLAERGDVSPYSRTSTFFDGKWPIKPEICLEGGNVLTDGAGDYAVDHPLVSLATTDARDDSALGAANATSAATAQAARLAALV